MEDQSRRKGKEIAQISQNTGFPELYFSLVELTILVQILRNIELTTIISNPDEDLHKVFQYYKNQYISRFSHLNFDISPMVRGTFDKMNQFIVYYNCLLNEIKIPVQANEADKLELIKNRTKDLSLTMDIDKYKFLIFDEFNFRKALAYCYNDPNISADQLYKLAMSILHEKGEKVIDRMCSRLRKISNAERNIFIIWHLFAFAKMRIRSFILFYKQYPNYYDNILENFWQLMIQQGYNDFLQFGFTYLN
uniref:Uncharacterized protein n=1 Tax=Meloidogyne enterolobii TaxID=390850 RepID=A0A6V7VMG1_MELEN|nr:unnamed protein product [Meloidogyne enterolobii]